MDIETIATSSGIAVALLCVGIGALWRVVLRDMAKVNKRLDECLSAKDELAQAETECREELSAVRERLSMIEDRLPPTRKAPARRKRKAT